jgi:shikimate dehydrogenase
MQAADALSPIVKGTGSCVRKSTGLAAKTGIVGDRMTGAAPSQHAKTRRILLGLAGAPIKHSAAPAMYEAAALALGWKCFYQLAEIHDADAAILERLLHGVRLLGFAGINVTYPYKETVIPFLDALSETASLVGAVNTIVACSGYLTGHNTDSAGFREAIAGLVSKKPGPVAIIGAGGFGKAAAVALAQEGVTELRVFDLDRQKSDALAGRIAPLIRCFVVGSVAEAVRGAAGVINATPAGMLPSEDCPVDPALLHSGLWVADAVYNPLWTPFLLRANEAGAEVLSGRAVAINQAHLAFELFTGMRPSREVMAAAFDAAMAARTETERQHKMAEKS